MAITKFNGSIRFWLACSCFFAASFASAQIQNVGDDTSTPAEGVGHDYIHFLGETVSPANGSLSINIKVPMPPGRGISLPFSVSYNSQFLSISPSIGLTGWNVPSTLVSVGGWSYTVPIVTAAQGQLSTHSPGQPLDVCNYLTSYLFQDASGRGHPLHIDYMDATSTQSNSACSPGLLGVGTGYYPPDGGDCYGTGCYRASTVRPVTLYSALQLFDADGTRYSFGAPTPGGDPAYSIEDRNGNKIAIQFQTGGGFAYTDDLNRTVLSASGIGPAGATNSISAAGSTYQVAWGSAGSGGTTFSVYPVLVAGDPSYCFPPTPAPGAAPGGGNSVQSITLPNNQQYQFKYGANSYGKLDEIDYPSGASVKYTWTVSSQTSEQAIYDGWSFNHGWYLVGHNFCRYHYSLPVVASRTVSYGGAPVLTQTFAYTTTWGASDWTTKTTTVTTTDLVQNKTSTKVYTYTPLPVPTNSNVFPNWPSTQVPMESTVQYYDSGSSSPTRTVHQGWAGDLALLCEVDTLEDGITSSGKWTYPGTLLPTDTKDYDFGKVSATACQGYTSPAPGGFSRETVTAYQSFSTTPLATSIGDKPSSVIVKDGSGNRLAETDYAYDQTATSSVTATGHDDSLYPAGSGITRGNLTTKTNKCFVGATNCTDSVSTYTYDQTGQVTSMTDPCGNGPCSDVAGTSHTTTYSYADSFVSGSGSICSSNPGPGGNTNALLTQITSPITNGVQHTQCFSYDYNTGQLTGQKDQNGQVTTYAYSDPFFRPTQVNSPDGGLTTMSYNDSPYNTTNNTPSVTTTKKVTSTLNLVSTAAMDGIGHPVRTLLSSDPDGTDITDTTYDGMGHVFTQSNPHRSSALSTDGSSTYAYDTLGRTKTVTEQDGSIISTAYSGNCTTTTDEAGKIRKSCSDALGRLIEVDEPGTGAVIGTPGTGSVTISGAEQSSSGTSGTASVNVANNGEGCLSTGHGGYYPQSGTVSVIVRGITSSTSWGGSCDGGGGFTLAPTMSQIVSNLAGALTGSSAGVTAVVSGTSITITATTIGAGTNYTLSTNYSSTGNGGISASGPTSLSGGRDAATDSGTVSVTVNGFLASQNYASGSTAQAITSGLAATLNSGSSPVSAAVSGTVITMTARQAGVATNYSVSASSTWNTQSFSSPSFSGSPSIGTLSGGTDSSLGTSPLVTLYSYDVLNNLTCAVQKGTDTTAFTTCAAASSTWRPRSFAYDSLSRLLSVTNPESGTISYTYDLNGNVATKVAPMPNKIPADTSSPQTVTTTFNYDALNRLTKKTYSDGTTPTVQFGYDGVALSGCTYTPPVLSDTNPKGRRTSMCDGSGGTTWALDITASGWRSTEARTLHGTTNVTKNTVSQNNLGGMLSQLTYPSGRIVNYTSGGAGRLLGAQDSNGANYAASATYAPFGGLTGMTNGSAPITTVSAYNERLQPVTLSAQTTPATVFSLSYDFHRANGDNGNVFQIVNNRDNNRNQTFTYDLLNRIASGQSQSTSGPTCWGEGFTIDSWGNLTNKSVTKCVAETLNAPAATSNRISGYCYDLAGNMLGNSGCPSLPYTPTYTYDAENRLKKFGDVTYTYDGDGNRVKKSNGTLYWGSGPLGESDLSGTSTTWKEYIFFNGKRVARRDASNSSVHYYFSDHLGSSSIITDAVGTMSLCPSGSSPLGYTTVATGEDESDYFPYGGERQLCNRVAQNYKFTGKERDTESGLDNFGFRNFASTMGRFMRPDEPFAGWDQHDPQSFNLYSYVENNPVSRTDPDGHTVSICDANGQYCTAVSDKDYAQAQQQDQYNHAGSLDQLKKNDGSLSNITDSSGNVVGTVMYTHDENAPVEGVNPEGENFLAGWALGNVVGRAAGAVVGEIASWFQPEGRVVIGKMADLEAKGAIRSGEKALADDLADMGSPKANWAQNSSKLREVMSEGKPIRDVSAGNPGSNTGFLRAERNLLENHGWTMRGDSWYPPGR